MKQPALSRQLPRCPNCGQETSTPYCGACGQSQTTSMMSVADWLGETLREVFSLEGRLFASFRMLLFSPGHLDLEWHRGRRRRYLGPMRLYLIAAALVFSVLSLTGSFGSPIEGVAEGWVNDERLGSLDDMTSEASRVTAAVSRWVAVSMKWLMIFGLVPALAVLSRVCLGSSAPYLASHIVMSLHVHAAVFFWSAVVSVVLKVISLVWASFDVDHGESIGVMVMMLYALVYVGRQSRRLLEQHAVLTVLRLVLISVGYVIFFGMVAVAMVLLAERVAA